MVTGFEELLEEFAPEDLEASASPVIGMWPDSRIAYLNPAYARFARDNGGGDDFLQRWGLGTRMLDALPDELRGFYASAIDQVIGSGRMWEHSYRCPSPGQQQRYRMRLYPVRDHRGVLAVHTLVWTGPHALASADDAGRYHTADGLIVQCASCRHVRRVDRPNQWDFVVEYVIQSPPETSHGLCSACAAEYLMLRPRCRLADH